MRVTDAPILLEVHQTETDTFTRRTVRLLGISDERHDHAEIFYDLLGERDIPAQTLLDGFVLGVIFFAMERGRPLHVRGQLSRQFLRNIHEFQSTWVTWRPGRYREIAILADEVVEDFPAAGPDSAIATFSGGVDGFFTAIRHSQGLPGPAGYPLQDVLLIHGFDVPLNREAEFDELSERVRPVVEGLGLRLHRLRTNLRGAVRQGWEHSFGAQMASALHNYEHAHRYALFGSGAPYNAIVYPWGSSPITDHLFGNAAMRFVLDGSAFSRTEKCELLARYPQALAALQVCWEGRDRAHNCGQCEKCIRTKMNLLAVGVDDPPCFAGPLEVDEVVRLRPRNRVQRGELQSILDYAHGHGVRGDWVDALARVVAQSDGRAPATPAGRFVRSLLDLVGRR